MLRFLLVIGLLSAWVIGATWVSAGHCFLGGACGVFLRTLIGYMLSFPSPISSTSSSPNSGSAKTRATNNLDTPFVRLGPPRLGTGLFLSGLRITARRKPLVYLSI
jgi:hypothetical protein